jgi:Ca-activated chloride channel family protein
MLWLGRRRDHFLRIALIGLVLVPIAILLYLWMQRRKRKYAVQYASLSLIREARPGSSRWRRHVPFALLLASMAALVLALARPETTLSVPEGRTSIILALDVSRSMCSTDVDPNRLAVAQDAAQKFVDRQPKGTRLGLVAPAGTSQLLVPDDRQGPAVQGDRRSSPRRSVRRSATRRHVDRCAGRGEAHIEPSTLSVGNAPGRSSRRVPHEPDIIVLLTDGANTRVEPPVQQAADRVRAIIDRLRHDAAGAARAHLGPRSVASPSVTSSAGWCIGPGGRGPSASAQPVRRRD